MERYQWKHSPQNLCPKLLTRLLFQVRFSGKIYFIQAISLHCRGICDLCTGVTIAYSLVIFSRFRSKVIWLGSRWLGELARCYTVENSPMEDVSSVYSPFLWNDSSIFGNLATKFVIWFWCFISKSTFFLYVLMWNFVFLLIRESLFHRMK